MREGEESVGVESEGVKAGEEEERRGERTGDLGGVRLEGERGGDLRGERGGVRMEGERGRGEASIASLANFINSSSVASFFAVIITISVTIIITSDFTQSGNSFSEGLGFSLFVFQHSLHLIFSFLILCFLF